MTDTLPIDPTEAQEPPRKSAIPEFNPDVRYSEASWTDAHHIAIEAVRSDEGNVGLVEVLAANSADWRYILITEGNPELGIFPLDIFEPDIDVLKHQAVAKFPQYADKMSYQTEIWLWGRYRFPGDQGFHEHLCWLITNEIARARKLDQVHECRLVTLDGETVTLADKPKQGRGKEVDTPIVYMADALSWRRDECRIIVRNYCQFMRAAKTNAEVERLIMEFQSNINAAVGAR